MRPVRLAWSKSVCRPAKRLASLISPTTTTTPSTACSLPRRFPCRRDCSRPTPSCCAIPTRATGQSRQPVIHGPTLPRSWSACPEEDAPLKADMYWVGGEVTCIQVTQRGIPNHAWGTLAGGVIDNSTKRNNPWSACPGMMLDGSRSGPADGCRPRPNGNTPRGRGLPRVTGGVIRSGRTMPIALIAVANGWKTDGSHRFLSAECIWSV